MTEEALTRLGDIAYVEQTFDSFTRLQEALHKVFAQYFQCKFRDEFVGYWSDAFHRMLAGASRMKKIRVSSK